MGFNCAQEKAKFDREWLRLRKEYTDAGMSEAAIQKIYGNTAQMTFFAQKEIPTIKNDRNNSPKCPHMRTDSSCQAGPVSQNQIRKCE